MFLVSSTCFSIKEIGTLGKWVKNLELSNRILISIFQSIFFIDEPISYYEIEVKAIHIAHLNDVRFNSNWVFFTHDDCLKVDIQYQKFLKIPKFGLTEGIIFNSESCKLSWSWKWMVWQISEILSFFVTETPAIFSWKNRSRMMLNWWMDLEWWFTQIIGCFGENPLF